ncbi:septum site-determining protein Ssd [Arthrobacter rhombi]|uniref:septum site-determining protein Ssd n=1 Tax=Arthrobacter rhombi TaxID=71253 RepID=UPI003FD3F427
MDQSPAFTPSAPPSGTTAEQGGGHFNPTEATGWEQTENGGPAGTGCLLVTRDERLADHVALIAAACGVVLQLQRTLPDTVPEGCSMILLGHDAALESVAGRLGAPVVLVGFGPDGEDLWRAAARDPGSRVAVLPEAAAWLGEYLGERALHSGRGRVTVFSGATGGAGTTTLAVLSAVGAGRRGVRSLLVDVDPQSRGLWPLLGRPTVSGVGWEDFMRSRGRIAPGHLADVLPAADGTAVLTWSGSTPETLPPAMVNEVIAASRRTFDTVVVDAGRAVGVDQTLASLADSVIIVAPGTMTGVGPARPGGGQAHRGPRRLVVTGRLPTGIDPSRLASAVDLELLGYVPATAAFATAAGEGRLGGVFTRRRLRRRLRTIVGWTLPPDDDPASLGQGTS